LKLVDYDGMYVPALQRLALPNAACGMYRYQHPQRENSRYFGPESDNFSNLLIYASLLALSHDPSLREEDDTDSIIAGLDPADLWHGASPFLHRLANLDPEITACLKELRRACGGPLEGTRRLHEVLSALGPRTLKLSFPRVRLPVFPKEIFWGMARVLSCIFGQERIWSAVFGKERLRRFAGPVKAKLFQTRLSSVGARCGKQARTCWAWWKSEWKLWAVSFMISLIVVASMIALAKMTVEPGAQKAKGAPQAERKEPVRPSVGKTISAFRPQPALPLQSTNKPKTPPVQERKPAPKPLRLPSRKERLGYANIGIRRDRSQGKGHYESWFNSQYGKGAFKAFLGEYYRNYTTGKEIQGSQAPPKSLPQGSAPKRINLGEYYQNYMAGKEIQVSEAPSKPLPQGSAPKRIRRGRFRGNDGAYRILLRKTLSKRG
jgi:hypothetical protein